MTQNRHTGIFITFAAIAAIFAASCATQKKLSSIQGFKGIITPMVKVCEGYVPDYNSRYFTEDFPYGIRYIWKLAHDNDVSCPNIDMVYKWGMSKISNAK